MIKIFADTHKVLASEMYDNIYDIYGIKLDKKSLLWGSVWPDISLKYKFIRHYREESIDYIVKKIINLIYSSRCLDLQGEIDPAVLKLFSKKVGIISHYLADYTCMPHAKRWTFKDNMVKHIKYEAKLDEITSKNYDFRKNRIMSPDLSIYDIESGELYETIKNYINDVVEKEYTLKEGYENDLDFALSLNLKIAYFILDTVEVSSREFETSFLFDMLKLNLAKVR